MPVNFSKKGHIATVGLNSPDTRNGLGPDNLYELYGIWEECQKDHEIRAVVLHSALPDIFCSGMDLNSAIPILSGTRKPESDGEKWLITDAKAVGKAMLKFKELDRPVIAAVNGYCLTGGWEMVMGCELKIASEDAVFQMREATLGIMPIGGANVFLKEQVGQTRALEILLTGGNFSAETLYNWGFLNRVVSREKLMDAAMELAEKIAGNGPRAVRGICRCAREASGLPRAESLDIEMKIGAPIFMSEDVREGIRAQKEKRKPDFT